MKKFFQSQWTWICVAVLALALFVFLILDGVIGGNDDVTPETDSTNVEVVDTVLNAEMDSVVEVIDSVKK